MKKKLTETPDTCGRRAKDLAFVLPEIQKREEKQINIEKIFEDIMSINFPNLVKGIYLQIQESQSMNPK